MSDLEGGEAGDPSKNDPLEQARQTPEFREARRVSAAVLGPYAMRAIDVATFIAGGDEFGEPDDRFALLRTVADIVLDDPNMHQYTSGDFSRYQSRVMDLGLYSRIVPIHGKNLVGNALNDAHWVSGGAAKFLESRGEDSERGRTLARSRGLLLAATVDDEARPQIRQALGEPFIDTSHFVLNRREEGSGVGFTVAAQEVLLAHPSTLNGCPAHEVPSPMDQSQDLLTHFWAKFNEYMYPAAA